MSIQKRALAVQDLSCVGKCSAAVVLPVLSAAGVETCLLPTSVLSTHTGGFGKPVFCDLTGQLAPFLEHWASFGLSFDAVSTGYLASEAQVEAILTLFDRFGKTALKLVDPVMGDNGKLYSGFSPHFPEKLKALCAQADVLVPNCTEAALLLGRPYAPGPHTPEQVEELLHALGELCPGSIVLTGVHFDEKELGAACFDRATDVISYAFTPRLPGHFPGTGDLFAAALLGAILKGKPLGEAAAIAARFTAESIKRTDPARESKYGVAFEAALPDLMQALGIIS